MKQGIFISYRRDTGSTMARMIFDRLRLEKKYQCFLDVEKLSVGNFRENIHSEMQKCDIFLLILSKNSLNRCVNLNDNVRQEIEAALEEKLAIIPVMAEDFVWPEKMPEGLESIQDYNAIPYVQVYSEQFFERLYSFIEAVRAEERAKENAIRDAERAARNAERAAKAKEKLKGIAQSSASALSDLGRSTAEAAKNAMSDKAKPEQAAPAAAPKGEGAPAPAEKPSSARDASRKPEPADKRTASGKKSKAPVLIAAAAVVILALGAFFLFGRGGRSSAPVPAATDASQLAAKTPAPAETPAPTETPAPSASQTETPAPTSAPAPAGSLREITAGTSREDASPLASGEKVTGRYASGEAWFSFTTGSDEDAKYWLTLQNHKPDSKTLYGYIQDASGSRVIPAADNSGGDQRLEAASTGVTAYAQFSGLLPDTTYYVSFSGDAKADYSIAFSQDGQRASICAPKTLADPAEAPVPCAYPDDAPLLQLNEKYTGRYESGCAWFSFTTGGDEDTKYWLTLQNHTPGSKTLYGYIYDEYGQVIWPAADNSGGDHRLEASASGVTAFAQLYGLLPDTTYYVSFSGDARADYSIAFSQDGESASICAPKTPADPAEAPVPCVYPDDAPLLQMNEKYTGRYTSGYAWFSFTTGGDEDAKYWLTLQNHTPGSKTLYGYIYDEYGQVLWPMEDNSGGDYRLEAAASGVTAFAQLYGLLPDTTYYVSFSGDAKADYSIAFSQDGQRASICAPKTLADPAESLLPCAYPDDAPLLGMNEKYTGRYASGYAWFSFTTGGDEDAKYWLTLQNHTPDSKTLYGYIYNEYGQVLWPMEDNSGGDRRLEAAASGVTAFASLYGLLPDTTYYVSFSGDAKADYSIAFSLDGERSSICAPKTLADPAEELTPCAYPDGAPLLGMNGTYTGRYASGYAWFSFTTGGDEDASYTIHLKNLTPESRTLYGYIYNEYGQVLSPMEDNSGGDHRLEAPASGDIAYAQLYGLLPGTTYYVSFSGDARADYEISVSDQG